MAEGARGACGVVEFDPLVEAVDLRTLNSRSRSKVSFWVAKGSSRHILPDFVDEVELDSVRWHFVHRCAFFTLVFVELRVGIVRRLLSDFDDTIVLKASLQSGLLGLRLPRLANVDFACKARGLQQPCVNLAKVVVHVQRTHPVASLAAESITSRRVCQWRIQAVEVPVLAAIVTGDDGTSAKR